ncbi:hypothetical protein Asp14428_05550 [Actinoplanes sp. NBRC 14428]|nr:hypothetical protein Asp14428_05550 [Actinoplanes sp. NBRC 14428]
MSASDPPAERDPAAGCSTGSCAPADRLLPSAQVMSASDKPRLAGRQPFRSRWGAPGEDLAGVGTDAGKRGPRAGSLTSRRFL